MLKLISFCSFRYQRTSAATILEDNEGFVMYFVTVSIEQRHIFKELSTSNSYLFSQILGSKSLLCKWIALIRYTDTMDSLLGPGTNENAKTWKVALWLKDFPLIPFKHTAVIVFNYEDKYI